MTNIDKLIKQRKSIKKQIKHFYVERKNAIELAEQYQDLTAELNKFGVHARAMLDFLYPKFWKTYPKCFENHNMIQFSNPNNKTHNHYILTSKNQKNNKTQENTKQINQDDNSIKIEKEKFYYILTLACSFKEECPHEFNIMDNYITSLGLKFDSADFNNQSDKNEKINKYLFIGTDGEFNILKICVRNACDVIKNDKDIEVYGCKRKY